MDFHRLMARLSEIERRAPVVTENDMMSSMPPMKDSVAPPSMSLNFNAQGIDSIDQMMKLFQKVNPDMMPKISPMATSLAVPTFPMSSMHSEPEEPGANGGIDDGDGDDDSMLALPIDADGDEDGELDNEKNEIAPLAGLAGAALGGVARSTVGSALSGAVGGDTDEGVSDAPQDKKEDSNFENEPDENYKSIDYMTNQLAGGMNRPKGTYANVPDGDNPMQRVKESGDLRSQIRAELTRRLAEAKGAK
jgi:hypothetical protein